MKKNYITDSSWKLNYHYKNMRLDGEEKYLFVATNAGTERIYLAETMELLIEKPKIYFSNRNIFDKISSDNKMFKKFEIAITNNITEYLLPIQNLPSGLYLLKISTNNFNQTFNILRDR